jgi:hypothetical protein
LRVVEKLSLPLFNYGEFLPLRPGKINPLWVTLGLPLMPRKKQKNWSNVL